MNRFMLTLLALALAAGSSIAAPAAQKATASKAHVFAGEIWDQTCAKRSSHTAMAEEAGIPRGPNRARECTLKCAEMGSPLVLYNPTSKRLYNLDNPSKAKPFAGEKVKVTGTLDRETNTIHVESIAPAG